MQESPEKIYNWQNSQLSVAKYAGGCTYNGAQYIIAYAEDGQPLVRMDLLKEGCPDLPIQMLKN